jgi:xylan 1,4-beta-xylosidase
MRHGMTAIVFACAAVLPLQARAAATQAVRIDATGKATPFPHFWERMFGSGHATLAMREDYLDDLRAVKRVTGFGYVRFHGILDDDVGVYGEDENGKPVYNFTLVDRIYDGLLRNGVKPVVEIGFMPKKLAFNPDALHAFWYKPNVSPPKSFERWDGLIRALAQHLVQRYGIDEVSTWYFEVWNEPNIDFWGGVPRQASYFDLYDHTARALKSVDRRLRVGGPATAAASWVGEFLAHAAKHHVPVDFVSTHGYADDTVQNLFHDDTPVPEDDRVCRAVRKVRNQIAASPMPHLPLLWTEWNVPGRDNVRDTTYVGPELANTVRECDGLVDMMSFWTFSDVFEEDGPSREPFDGQYGLRASGGIDKPSYYDFSLLHQLGEQRLANPADDVIVTRRADGGLAIAAWNLVDPGQHGSARTLRLVFANLRADARATIQRVDDQHGNVLPIYARMGNPRYPTMAQVAQMNAATALPPPVQERLDHGVLTLALEPNALVLVTVRSH